MNVEELQAMQAQVATALRQMDTSYVPPPQEAAAASRYSAYHQAAAVLSTFDSETLNPAGGAGDAPTESEREVLLADSAFADDRERGPRWVLLPEVRQDVLRELGTREAMQSALEANPDRPNDTLQSMLEAYIRGAAPPLEKQDARQLAATFQVVGWLSGVVEELPSREAITRRADMVALLQPFYDLAGTYFRGREEQLSELRDYVGVLPPGSVRERFNRIAARIFNLQERPPLVIHGPGGMGKSALVARFIWEHTTRSDAEPFPFAYIDFDRPALVAEEPLTLLIEAVRQLGVQYPDAQEHCDRLRRDWREELARRTRPVRSASTSTISAGEAPVVTTSTGPHEWNRYLRDFASLLSNLKIETDPFLFVLDTFEEVQYRSEVVVQGLCEFLKTFQSHVPRLRTVLAGRAPIRGVPGFPTEEVELGDFDAEAARGFLEGHSLPPDLARTIAGQVGGNPLTLKLAAEVWRKEGANRRGIAGLQTHTLLGFRVRENEIQGQLFTRILSHIHDPDVRKLAHPGLVLRRLTPDLIRQVLAEPCGVVVRNAGDAQRLFDEMQREVALVTVEDGALRHRPDVRRIMIRLLREREPEKVRRIEEAAVAYYTTQDAIVARAEEIYHRLSLKQPENSLNERWIEGVQPYLFGALEELSVREQAWLAPRLGRTLNPELRLLADLEGWERDTERRARALLERSQVVAALAALQERKERTPGSPLYALEALAWERSENWTKARRVIQEGIASASESGNSALAVDLRLRGARVDVRSGDFPAAQQKLDEAEMLVQYRGGDPARLLEVGLNRLAVRRAQGADSAVVTRQNAGLRELFRRLSDEQIGAHPVLMAWLGVEIGQEYPGVLRRILPSHGLKTTLQTQLRALAQALATWDMAVSKKANEAPGVLARKAGVTLPDAPQAIDANQLAEAWTAFALRADPTALSRGVALLMEEASEGRDEVIAAIREILRSEVEDALVPQPPAAAPPRSGSRATSFAQERSAASPSRSEATPEYAMAALHLTKPQVRQFSAALLDAFPSRDALAQMVRFRLDRSLESLALTDDLVSTTSRLIEAAQTEGWSAQLLAAARQARPENAPLLVFAQQFGLAPVPRQERELEQRLIRGADSLDVTQWRSRMGRLMTQVCRVEIGGARSAYATGFLIGPDVLLTVYHAVESVIQGGARPQDVALRFDYQELPHARPLNEGSVFRLADDWLIDYSPYSPAHLSEARNAAPPEPDELNYALLRVAGAPGSLPVGGERAELDAAPRGWIDIAVAPRDLAIGTPLVILHHPQGRPLQVSIDSEGVRGFDASGLRVWYQTVTEGGSSGSPCFDLHWNPIAMHHRRIRASRGKEEIQEGILLTAILDRLKMRGKLDWLTPTS
jgi:hypothetical protein